MSQRGPLLAIFYAHLDPAGIPTASELDQNPEASSGRPTQSVVLWRVFTALEILVKLPVSQGGALWTQRVWPWMEFLHTFRDNLPDLPTEHTLYSVFLALLVHVQQHWDAKVIASTPRVRVIVATAWVIFLDLGDTEALKNIAHFIYRDSKVHGISWKEEYMDGAGGTTSDLASMVVRHIKYAVDRERMSATDFLLLMVTAKFLFATTNFKSKASEAQGSYETELLAHGFAGVLTEAICGLNFVLAEHSSGPQLLNSLLLNLGNALVYPPGYLWVAEALKAGLLRAIVMSALSGGHSVHPQLEFWVTSLIPGSMVYRCVVRDLDNAYRDIEDLATNRAFRQSSLFNDWRAMTILSRERVDLLDDEEEMEEEDCMPFKGCDNVEVRRIHCHFDHEI